MEHPIFNIQLTLDQVNLILATVGKLPYESIAPLMNSIQVQASTQMQQYNAATAQQAEAESQASQASEDTGNIIQ
jgi:hypothetical protein